jgi:hypothetical protein
MKVMRIEHVQLAMPAGGEMLARGFYGGILGIPETPKPPNLAKRGGCWFERSRPSSGPQARLFGMTNRSRAITASMSMILSATASS